MSLFGNNDKDETVTPTTEETVTPTTEETVTPTTEETITPTTEETITPITDDFVIPTESDIPTLEEANIPSENEDKPDLHGMTQKELLTYIRDNICKGNPFKLQLSNLLDEVIEKI